MSERLDFLVDRQSGLGGTDAPAILGLHPGRNALDVYHSKTRPILPEDASEDEKSVDIRRGNGLEDQARAEYWKATGRRGRNVRTPTTHPEFPAFRCHLDFEIFSDSDRPERLRGPGVGETKCPRAFVLRKVAENGVRDTELVQGLTYCAVARRDWVGFNLFSWEYDAGPVLPVDVVAFPDLGRYILETGQRFWDEHVVPRVPPDPAEWKTLGQRISKEAIEHAVRTSSGELYVVEEPSFAEEARRLADLKALAKEADASQTAISETLQKWIEENSPSDRIRVPGVGKLTIVRNDGRESFSRKALEGHRPIDRDKLWKWLAEATPTEIDNLNAEGAERLLEELRLDLDGFVRKGEPYSYLLVTPEK